MFKSSIENPIISVQRPTLFSCSMSRISESNTSSFEGLGGGAAQHPLVFVYVN